MIVGTSGSGKSTLARKLSKSLKINDIELDGLYWLPHWTESALPEFRSKILSEMNKSTGFVIHGNYNKVRDITWKNSEIVIWLDYPKYIVMWRVLRRSILRLLKNETLWAGNKESFKKTFLSKDSIILWAWNTYELRRKQYEHLIVEPEYKHIKVFRINSPKELKSFLSKQNIFNK